MNSGEIGTGGGALLVRTPNVSYDELRRGFRWRLPEQFNLGAACSDHQPASLPALIQVEEDGSRRHYAFGELSALSSRLANALEALGVGQGDRVGIVLPQRVEAGIAHLATYKVGAIVVPMSGLLGPEALAYRLRDCEPRVVITDAEHLDSLSAVVGELGGIELVCVEGVKPPHHGFWELIQAASERHQPAMTNPDTPALLIYTSGTTGEPKGTLHGHRVLHGHLPGFELSHEFFPAGDDLFWTPADWAWIGGLMDALMPTWFHGRAIVGAARAKFDPEWAVRLMVDHRVRNAFLPPTVLKMMRQGAVDTSGLGLRTVMSGGEVLGEEMLDWGRESLGLTINEIFGQTEANYVVGNCSAVWEVRAGSMGRPYPGHDVVILTPDGAPATNGVVGEVAVRTPDPVVFLEYWGRSDATREKFTPDGRWLRTGDLASCDRDGYLWYAARADDIINSGGYRIGPNEVERCLMTHPAVAMAAVVGIPDPVRGEAVKAFVVLVDGHVPSCELETQIRNLVKDRLAKYAYPREIEFVDELPLTATGKIRRADLRGRDSKRRSGDNA
jgi:acetyl-CoA synthetase